MNGTADPAAVAYGSYDPAENHVSNFAVLNLETNSSYADDQQMYAAGYLESAFTAAEIYDGYMNGGSLYPWGNNPPACLTNFWSAQVNYVQEMIATSTDNPLFWQELGLVMAQYSGLISGYANFHAPGQELDPIAFFLINAAGDMGDILSAACPEMAPNFEQMDKDEVLSYAHQHGHCSALVKLTGNYSQLFISHSSWFSYVGMLRIMKHCK